MFGAVRNSSVIFRDFGSRRKIILGNRGKDFQRTQGICHYLHGASPGRPHYKTGGKKKTELCPE